MWMAGTAPQAAVHLQADTELGCSKGGTCKVPSAWLARLEVPIAVPFAHMPCCAIDIHVKLHALALINLPQHWCRDQFLQVAVRSLPEHETGMSSFAVVCTCLIRQSNAMPETALHIADPSVMSVRHDNIPTADLTQGLIASDQGREKCMYGTLHRKGLPGVPVHTQCITSPVSIFSAS